MLRIVIAALVSALFLSHPGGAGAAVIAQERVPGGVLELSWAAGFNTDRNLEPSILDASHPAYANPSGDHTVGVLTNTVPDSGGIALSATDALGNSDYTWEGWFFTGDGNTRRGLVLRANPANDFQSCYQFVINAGLLQVTFRKVVDATPSTLMSWFSNTFPGGMPQAQTWHHLKVIANGNTFRCFFDGAEITTTPIVDATAPLLTGWVGVYNFRFDLGLVPVYFDDLTLSAEGSTPAQVSTWGNLKDRYRR